MPEGRKPQIIRWEDITVLTAEPNDYGDLIVIDENSNEHKIAKKRALYFAVCQPGNFISLGIANYMDHDFVSEVKLVDGTPGLVKAAVKEGAKVESVTQKSDGRNRSYALSYSKDIAVALVVAGNKNDLTEVIIGTAKRFEKYLDTGD